ncbi:murein biosynthesis integral membrane protein MurJ [Flagellimonas onchidii]|uniref:murein biosynthesis integral membrane protein MurJ n=1 Tax=Flagellimonas onchidii TaxID=2562684 RepID=UPI0010A61A24|nr:lipid II flippase MurJ [Allomuricauda onchidii]
MYSILLNKVRELLKNNVVNNILIVGSITLLIKGLGFYKETLVASNFGLSVVLDTFFIAFLIPGFIQNVFLESFNTVFIPNYISETKSENGNIGSFQGLGFVTSILAATLFSLVAVLGTDFYLESFFPGKEEAFYDLVKSQFYIMLPCMYFWSFSSILGALLNINNEFTYSSFSGVFIALTIIVSILFFREALGEMLLATSTLIGSILEFAYLLIVCLQHNIIKLAPPDFKNKNAQVMFKQIPAKVSSGFLTGMNGVVDQFFAAQLVVGSIAAINYGLKMPSFLMGMLVIALTSVLLPQFSKMVLEDRENAYRFFYKIMKFLFIGASFFAIAGIFLSDFLVELFFQRNEFTAEDTVVVSKIQKIFLVYTPFAICGMVTVSFLTSLNKNAVMAYVSLLAVVLNFIGDYFLYKYFGVFGIALCTTIVVVIKNIFLFYFTVKIRNQLSLQA